MEIVTVAPSGRLILVLVSDSFLSSARARPCDANGGGSQAVLKRTEIVVAQAVPAQSATFLASSSGGQQSSIRPSINCFCRSGVHVFSFSSFLASQLAGLSLRPVRHSLRTGIEYSIRTCVICTLYWPTWIRMAQAVDN